MSRRSMRERERQHIDRQREKQRLMRLKRMQHWGGGGVERIILIAVSQCCWLNAQALILCYWTIYQGRRER